MRFRIRKASAVIVLAAASVLASTGFGGTALAAGQSLAGKAVQLTGAQLATALLPASAFPRGYRYDRSTAYNSGKRLETGHARYHLATIGCAKFGNVYERSGFGETAVAANAYSTLAGDYTSPVGAGFAQLVYQFASANAARSFWTGLRSIAVRCPGWGVASLSGTSRPTLRIVAVRMRGALAFQVYFSISIKPLGGVRLESLVVVKGQDVFETDGIGVGRAVPASPSVRTLMGELIPRIVRAQ